MEQRQKVAAFSKHKKGTPSMGHRDFCAETNTSLGSGNKDIQNYLHTKDYSDAEDMYRDNYVSTQAALKDQFNIPNHSKAKSLYETQEDLMAKSSSGVLSDSSNRQNKQQLYSPGSQGFLKYINAYDKENEDDIVESPNEKVPRKEPTPELIAYKQNEASSRQSVVTSSEQMSQQSNKKKFVLSYGSKKDQIQVVEQESQEQLTYQSEDTRDFKVFSHSKQISNASQKTDINNKTKLSAFTVNNLQPTDNFYYNKKDTSSPLGKYHDETPIFHSVRESNVMSDRSSFNQPKPIVFAQHQPQKSNPDELADFVNQLLKNFDSYTEEESEQVEELILELHSHAKQNNGKISEEFKERLLLFQVNLSHKKKHFNETQTLSPQKLQEQTQTFNFAQYRKPQVESPQVTKTKSEMPEFLQQLVALSENSDQLILGFTQVMEDYKSAISTITAKKLTTIKGILKPSKLELNTALACVLLFSSIDTSILLTPDKANLQDRNWSVVNKYLSNGGKVMQNIRKLKQALDGCKVSTTHMNLINSLIDSPHYSAQDLQGLNLVCRDLYVFIRAAYNYAAFVQQQYLEIHPQQQADTFRSPTQRKLPTEHQEKTVSPLQPRKIVELTPQYDEFKFAVNNHLFQENVNFDLNLRTKKQEMEEAKKMILDLKKKEKEIKWAIERKDKAVKKELEKQEQKSYMQYQQELKQMFTSFLKEQMTLYKKQAKVDNQEKLLDSRLQRLREDAEFKLQMIDEFRKTLENMDWNQRIKKEVKEQRLEQHALFLQNLTEDKVFKQEMYAAQKLVDHEERKQKRKSELDFEHEKLLRQQQEILHNIEMMTKHYK